MKTQLWLWPLVLLLCGSIVVGQPASEEPESTEAQAARLYKEGEDHFNEGEYPETVEVFDRFLALEPGHREGLIYRAFAHSETGSHARAIADYNQLIQMKDEASTRKLRGYAHFYAGRFKECAQDLEKCAELDPAKADTSSYLPMSLYHLGEYERAARQCVLLHNPAKNNNHLVLIHFLCNMRLHGKDVATQKALTLPIGTKGEVPVLMELFQEKITLDELEGAGRVSVYYIQYFVGLWHEAHGRKEQARAALAMAFRSLPYDLKIPEVARAAFVHQWLLREPRPLYPPRYYRKAIVYVIDASGSTVDTLPFIMAELKFSMNGLSEQQMASVIFFQDGRYFEAVAPGYKSMTSRSRTRLFRWMDLESGNVVPKGSGDPRAAMKRAFELEPDLIFILSDNLTGRGRNEINQKTLRDDIARMNVDKRKINTIQFLDVDPLVGLQGWKSTMELIATDSGGLHKYVSPRDLGLKSE